MQAWSNVLQACLLLAEATARLASRHSFSKDIWINHQNGAPLYSWNVGSANYLQRQLR